MCSDSEKNMSAFADQNHAPSLTCVRLEFYGYENENFCVKIIVLQLYYKLFIVGEGRESCIVYVKY